MIKKFHEPVTDDLAIRVDFSLRTGDDEDSREFRGAEIENTGDAYRVFATVRQCVADYIKRHDQDARIAYGFAQVVPGSHERPPRPKEIRFIQFQCQSRFPSRIKLYDRIAQTASRWFPGFKLKRGPYAITEFNQPGIRWILERESNVDTGLSDMLIQEFTQQLNEYSYLDPEITQILKKKGFRKLGAGADQAAYLAPGGRAVLKIFGSGFRYTPKTGGQTRDQRMFETWANYCQSHSKNPYLPRFLPGEDGRVWRPFDFRGRRYLQIWQEYLPRSNQRLNQALVILDNVVDEGAAQDLIRGDLSNISDRDRRSVKFVKQRLGDPGFRLMVQTLAELQELAAIEGYRPDLHRDNFRSRADGTPVIMDPWHIG
jgi:hypothetical protein